MRIDGVYFRKDIVLLALVWILMLIAVNPIGNYPINDDWVYAESVKSIVEEGHFRVQSSSSANVGPQAYWGALFAWAFGLSYTSLRYSTQVLGFLGAIGTYLLFYEVWISRRIALVAALAVIVNPIYFSLSNTFMTDVPFFFMVVTSTFLIAAGMRTDRAGLLGVGLSLAIAAVLIRQFALFVLVGFALGYIAKRGLSWRAAAAAFAPLAIGILFHLTFNKWLADTGRKPFPSGINEMSFGSPGQSLGTIVRSSFVILMYLGLLLTPLVILCFPPLQKKERREAAWAWIGVVALSLVLGFMFVLKKAMMPVGGNILGRFGIGPLTNRDTFGLGLNIPSPSWEVRSLWAIATIISVLASSWLVWGVVVGIVRGVRRCRRGGPQLRIVDVSRAVFFVGAAASYWAILMLIAMHYHLFDRYYLPLMVFGGLAVPLIVDGGLNRAVGSGMRFYSSLVLLSMVACFSVVTTHDFLEWGRVRWATLQQLLGEGVSPDHIDGGYEFSGLYLFDPKYKASGKRSFWWVNDDEYVVSAGPMPGYRVIRRAPVNRWWKGGGADVFVLRRVESTD